MAEMPLVEIDLKVNEDAAQSLIEVMPWGLLDAMIDEMISERDLFRKRILEIQRRYDKRVGVVFVDRPFDLKPPEGEA